jgi:hypothetical protein
VETTVGSTTAVPLKRRFRSCRLLVNMCRLPALRRTILPLPVLVNRLLVPECVFIFITHVLWLMDAPHRMSMFGGHDHDQAASLHTGRILDGAGLGQLFNHGLHHGTPHFLIRHFSPTIGEGDFGFIAFF